VQVVTINVLDLPLDVPGSSRPLNLSLYKANTHAEVHPLPIPERLANLYQPGTIVRLSDDVLLKIFRYYYLNTSVSPQFWPTLVLICRKWRRIVFASPKALHLQLVFSPGIPVLKAVNCFPAFPITIKYGGSLELASPTPGDDIHIIAALKRSDRVRSISLTVTTSLLKKWYAVERPFSNLEDLILLSRDSAPLTFPSSFQWGPRLRRLHLTGITIPALHQLLYSSTNLVDLQLHEALNHFSIEVLTGALSGMAQLQILSLHFPSTTNYVSLPPLPDKLVVLPALTHLKFRGIIEYLERLVVRIDAPCLRDIHVTLFDNSVFNLSRLHEFIDRIKLHNLHRRAHIRSFDNSIFISLTQHGSPTILRLDLLSKPLSEQLSTLSRILLHLSAFLLNVEDLFISMTRWEDGVHSRLWVELMESFTGVKWLQLNGNDSKSVTRAFEDLFRHRETVLPALQKIYLPPPGLSYVPLSEPTVSFMTSRWRSGYPIGVEYNRLCLICEICHDGTGTLSCTVPPPLLTNMPETGPFSKTATIDHKMLCNDILLKIFRQYLDVTPRLWPILAHVCRRWQQVILRSPLGLQLRLYCTYGTPVLKTLYCWPPLPLVINYGGSPMLDPPTPEDEDNIIAAFKESDRINSISLTLTNSLLEKLSTISEPFPELEELVLLSQDNLQLTLPSAFQWGLRLRTLHVTRITIPTLPLLLSSSTILVDLHLHEIPIAGYISPQVFANALSGASHLRSLSLHFLSFPPRRNYVGLPPPSGHRIILPALTSFRYRGISKYLDIFVARVDAPHLKDIDITFFSQPTIDASQLGQFIERMEMQTLFAEADIQTSAHAISISINSFKNSITSTPLRLQISCKRLDWQLSSLAQICDQFSPFLFDVRNLVFNAINSPTWQVDLDGAQWLQIVRSFGGASTLSISGETTIGILCALRPVDEANTTDTVVLPALRNLRVQKPMFLPSPFWDASQSLIQALISSRRLSFQPIDSEMQDLCHICDTGFTPQKLKEHLVALHAYKIVCLYCGDFQFTLAYIPGFQEHLRRKHPEVAQNDGLILQSAFALTPLQHHTLANRHSSLRKPEVVAPSTIITGPYPRSLGIQDP
jgi:hypothetical protein